MRRRQEPRGPRPPLPSHLEFENFDPAEWGCWEPWPSPAYYDALERYGTALREWCELYGTNPLELFRERRAARRADLFPEVPNPRHPHRRSTP